MRGTAGPGAAARRLVVLVALATLLLTSGEALASPATTATAETAPQRSSSGWVVEVASAGILPQVVSEARGRGGRVGREFRSAITGFVLAADAATAAALRDLPGVEAVEPDIVVRGADTQISPVASLDRIDQRLPPLSGTYSYVGDGSGVTAYVVDGGIRATHTEFAGRLATGTTVIDDGLGTADCDGHGTHVAGTLGGTTYGVAKGVTIVPVRVLGCDGTGLLSGIIAGLDWIVSQHVAGAPAVANMSLEATGSMILDNAVRRVIADGVTTVVAAGNGAADACGTSPARVAGALTIGSVSGSDVQSTFSNSGTCLDLYAPGEAVASAYFGNDTGSALASGTSMATPAVAGGAALLLGRNPTLTPDAIATALVAAATSGVVTGRGSGSPDRLLYLEPTVALAGVLRAASGTTVPGATVRVTRPDGGAVSSTVTSADGAYSLRVTTGPLRLGLGSPSSPVSDLPLTWSLSAAALTVTADRTLDLTLPAAVTTSVQVYDGTGAPVAGAIVTGSAYTSSVSTSLGAGLAPASLRSAPGGAASGADGRVALVSFPGTIATVTAMDTATGSTRTATAAGVVAGSAYALPAGGTGVRSPALVYVEAALAPMMRSLLATLPDVVQIRLGAAPVAEPAYGCSVVPPANSSEAAAALTGSVYRDRDGGLHDAPTGLCAPFSVTS